MSKPRGVRILTGLKETCEKKFSDMKMIMVHGYSRGLPFLRKYELCAISENRGICDGTDSGGPLVCEGLQSFTII